MDNLAKLGDFFVAALPWIMGAFFFVGCFFRYFINYTVKRHEWFAREFEKRVHHFMETQTPGEVKDVSFFVLTKKLLEKTYYEAFEIREKFQRRKYDRVMHWSDRLFLVKQGCAWLVKDILKQIKFLKWTNDTPKLFYSQLQIVYFSPRTTIALRKSLHTIHSQHLNSYNSKIA